jgi:hypothetical protein
MKKIKKELDSWDEGRAFMNRIADEIGAKVTENDADLIVKDERMTISCHFDARKFSYIVIKLIDERRENLVQSLLKEFKKN